MTTPIASIPVPFLLLPGLVLALGCSPRADSAVEPGPAEAGGAMTEPVVRDSDGTGGATSPDTDASSPSNVQGGVFAMQVSQAESEPPGCRTEKQGTWTFELPTPKPDEAWTALERFDAHGTEYACEGAPSAFTCQTQQGFDYSKTGLDADVSLVVTYAGSWSELDRIAGDFDLVFTCDGSACDQVAQQWTVTQFPCAGSGAFEGTLQ